MTWIKLSLLYTKQVSHFSLYLIITKDLHSFTRQHHRAIALMFNLKWMYLMNSWVTPMHYTRVAHIFQIRVHRSRLKILGARRLTWGKFHSEDQQIVDATVENSFVTATWRPVFMHPCTTPSIIQEKQFWSRNTLAPGGMGSLLRFMKCTWDISYCLVKCRLQDLRKSWQLYFKQLYQCITKFV